MKKKNIDKIRFIRFQAFSHDEESGTVYAYAIYDVRKVRRVKYYDLCDLIFEKTLQIYPFAIVVDKVVGWADASCNTAQIIIGIPLSPNMRITKITEGGAGQ